MTSGMPRDLNQNTSPYPGVNGEAPSLRSWRGGILTNAEQPCIVTADPQTVGYLEKIKMRVGELCPGMFVCELDRPWEETPFQPQGIEIQTTADIEALSNYCQSVFIDLERSRVDQATTNGLPGPYFCENGFSLDSKDLETAASLHSQTSELIQALIKDISFGQSLDIELARAAVSECVSHVLSNQEAMVLFLRLREKDEFIRQQAYNSCIYSIVIGRLLGYNSYQLEHLGICGLLHDIGKLTVPEKILNKAGPLTQAEMQIVHQHTLAGRDMLMSSGHLYSGSVDAAYAHHENLDGTGYPRGLQSEQINLNCKIISIVDKYDAITCPRPYRPMGDHLSAIAILNRLAHEHKIDSHITSIFVAYMGVYPPGSIVELSNGEIGIVLETHPKHHLRPKLLIVRDAEHNPCQSVVDMSDRLVDERGHPYRIARVRKAEHFGIKLSDYYDLIVRTLN